ncbi:hypothetical protein [Amycolatopsis pigmentata]|uniref:Uncharacterized protein n=1 Tax=Amycolatopsis pigmentata TaxID=450801 RepID=A0ABW5FTJ1_9PSEU
MGQQDRLDNSRQMSWARMVVVAVRDPGAGHPAARLARRLLLTAGFAAAAWLVGLVLGTFTASAAETAPSPTPDGPTSAEPQLLTTLTGTLGEISGLTHLTALTGTVEHVATQVTAAVSAVVPRPDGAADSPVTDRSDPPPPDSSTSRKSGIPSSVPRANTAPPPAPVNVGVTPQRPAPAAQSHPIVNAGARPAPSPREADPPTASQRANGNTPAPAPGRSDDHVMGVGAPHEAGGGKQPFVVPGGKTGAADRRPAGPVTSGKVLAPARKSALPATSPD